MIFIYDHHHADDCNDILVLLWPLLLLIIYFQWFIESKGRLLGTEKVLLPKWNNEQIFEPTPIKPKIVIFFFFVLSLSVSHRIGVQLGHTLLRKSEWISKVFPRPGNTEKVHSQGRSSWRFNRSNAILASIFLYL